MHTTLTLFIVALVTFIVTVITFQWLEGNAVERMRESCAKMWTRIQKAEGLADKDRRFFDGEFARLSKGLTETRKTISALTGMVSMDYSERENHIIAINAKGAYFLIDLKQEIPTLISLKKSNKIKDDMITVRYKDCDLEYKKPVDTDF